MDGNTFNQILVEQLAATETVLADKAAEYATDDRLHNFKVAAELQETTPIRALGGMMGKHTVSIYDMINKDGPFDLYLWNEKITDHINYLILLKALVIEAME